MTDDHECPAKGCKARVPNALFSCASDWWALSPSARNAIKRTASLSLLSAPRREAIAKAREEWNGIR